MSIFSIFRDNKFNKLINDFETSFSKIPVSPISDSSDNLVSQAIKHAIDDKGADIDVSTVFNSITVSPDRLARYNTYNEIFHAVQLIKRIVILYLNNLVQRDPISNTTLLVNPSEESVDIGVSHRYQLFSKKLISYFNLEDRIRSRTASDVLKFGDSFIEIINLDDIDNIKFPRIRSTKSKNAKNGKIETITERCFLEKLNSKNSYTQINSDDILNIVENYVTFTSSPYDVGNIDTVAAERLATITENKKSDDKNNNFDFSNIVLKFHSPHSVIPLITEYDNILGFIEVSTSAIQNPTNVTSNNLVNFANIINQVGSSSYISGNNKTDKKEQALKMFVDAIVIKVLKSHSIFSDDKNEKNDQEYSDILKGKLKSDLFYSLKKIILTTDSDILFKNKLNVRYISSDNMFHFKNPGSGSYYPYGDSVIDALIFPGKLYLLTQLANAVTRLSRSSIMRKWTIETGTREDVNSLLQKLKKNLKNQRITGDDIATSKNLPNILSDYKDLVTFKKKGTTFIDLDVVNTGDPNVNIRDLEDIRRELISLSGVPSSHLGYQDMSDIREQLINANVIFANEISAIQKSFNDNLTNLVARISQIINFEKDPINFKRNVKISLIPPTVLVLQNIETSINSISTIQRIFAEIPEIDVDPLYLLRRYCPLINWDEFEREAKDFKERKKVSSTGGADSGGMSGGFGGRGY